MHVDYPFRLNRRGRTATTTDEDHVRDLIEQVLFTAPGERANRPEFGSGVMQLVFAPNSVELAAATEALVQGALQKWLAEVIQVEGVDVATEDSRLEVTVRYKLRADQQSRTARFSREV